MERYIDRERVKSSFAKYVGNYDVEDEKILLKIKHTYRVAQICEQIARGLGMPDYDADLAWLIGMLHDIGRFEQLRRYDTFVDADSIDHAHFGVELLFEEGLLEEFLGCMQQDGGQDSQTEGVLPEETGMAEDILVLRKAIWNHSAFRIGEGLSQREVLFAKVIRDADKIDILKVASDVPLETIYDVTTRELHASPVTEEVMEQFRQGQAIIRSTKRVPVDSLVGHIALVFELEFPESYRLVEEQGYLKKLLAFETPNVRIQEQFRELRQRMEEFLKQITDG